MIPTSDVLVVEDEPDNTALLRALLEAHGYSVQDAMTGEDGLALARDNAFGIVIMDFGLPGAIDGIETVRQLRTMDAYAHTPVVGLTAYSQPHVHEDARRAGCNRVVTKPILDAKKFVDLIAELVRDLAPETT